MLSVTKMEKRKVADCRKFPDEENPGTLTISGTEEEVLDAAMQHAVAKHGHQDTREFRQELRESLEDED